MPGGSWRNQLLNISVDGRGSFTSDVLIRIGWGTPAQGKGTEDAQVQLRRNGYGHEWRMAVELEKAMKMKGDKDE